MSDTSSNNKRIAKNTLFLYFRMALIIVVNLFAVRIILKALGVEDYGIYNVVGGVVSLFSFLGGSLASGAQRFLAFEIGRKDFDGLQRVFSMTLVVFVCIALLLVILLETVGVWFLNNKMNIPTERMHAANWVFQFSVFTFLMNILVIPYNAAIIAWEKMKFYAYISIIESVSKLLCVFVLLYIVYDKLIIYSVMLLLISLILLLVYQQFVKRTLIGCSFKWYWNSTLCRSLLVYSGWNMVGTIALVLRNQGVNIVLNLFFNPIVNAAHTIGQQVNGAISQFINNIYMATRPQITKHYAEGDNKAMWHLVFSSAKLAYFLLYFLCLPMLLGIDVILKIWLGEIPEYTSVIVRILLVVLLIETSSNQIISVFQATNRIKSYQITSSVILLLNIPISYVCLKQYSFVYTPYIISIVLSLIYVAVLLFVAKNHVGLDVKKYLVEVLFKIINVSVVSLILPLLVFTYSHSSILDLFLIIVTSIFSISVTIWFLGLTVFERTRIIEYITQKIKKH